MGVFRQVLLVPVCGSHGAGQPGAAPPGSVADELASASGVPSLLEHEVEAALSKACFGGASIRNALVESPSGPPPEW